MNKQLFILLLSLFTFLGAQAQGLHEGFNAEIDLSATISSAKGFSGTGERINAAYVKEWNDKLSVEVGGYFSNYSLGIGTSRAAGLNASVNYKFNEKWEGYAYVQKNIYKSGPLSTIGAYHSPLTGYCSPISYDAYRQFGDRIGAGIKYNFNENSYIAVEFEFDRLPENNAPYHMPVSRP